jgi:AP-4 complex subunit epsilon-1
MKKEKRKRTDKDQEIIKNSIALVNEEIPPVVNNNVIDDDDDDVIFIPACIVLPNVFTDKSGKKYKLRKKAEVNYHIFSEEEVENKEKEEKEYVNLSQGENKVKGNDESEDEDEGEDSGDGEDEGEDGIKEEEEYVNRSEDNNEVEEGDDDTDKIKSKKYKKKKGEDRIYKTFNTRDLTSKKGKVLFNRRVSCSERRKKETWKIKKRGDSDI